MVTHPRNILALPTARNDCDDLLYLPVTNQLESTVFDCETVRHLYASLFALFCTATASRNVIKYSKFRYPSHVAILPRFHFTIQSKEKKKKGKKKKIENCARSSVNKTLSIDAKLVQFSRRLHPHVPLAISQIPISRGITCVRRKSELSSMCNLVLEHLATE